MFAPTDGDGWIGNVKADWTGEILWYRLYEAVAVDTHDGRISRRSELMKGTGWVGKRRTSVRRKLWPRMESRKATARARDASGRRERKRAKGRRQREEKQRANGFVSTS